MARFVTPGRCFALLPCLLVAACNIAPPRPWLRYEPAGPTGWTKEADGQLSGTLHGAAIRIDLGRRQTRIQVTVENAGSAALEFRMGPEASPSRVAIGEVKLRPHAGPPGVPGPDIIPYNSMQPLMVEAGWSGIFYLDSPLGRDPGVGQYFVLTVEARDATGAVERRSLPLRATNAGTMPASGT